MIRKLIVSHGNLARELLLAARAIAGDTDGFRAICLDWSEGCEEAERRIGEQLADLEEGDGALILTDMFGDTPSNAALSFVDPGRVEIVTGVNLPMVVRIACAGTELRGVEELARWIAKKGQASIRVASSSARSSVPAAPEAEGEG